jgi:hypothetical protein
MHILALRMTGEVVMKLDLYVNRDVAPRVTLFAVLVCSKRLVVRARA